MCMLDGLWSFYSLNVVLGWSRTALKLLKAFLGQVLLCAVQKKKFSSHILVSD